MSDGIEKQIGDLLNKLKKFNSENDNHWARGYYASCVESMAKLIPSKLCEDYDKANQDSENLNSELESSKRKFTKLCSVTNIG